MSQYPFGVGWLGGFLAYTGAGLILSSRDLRRRTSLVYWELFLRYIAALLVIPAGLFGDLGMIAVPNGLRYSEYLITLCSVINRTDDCYPQSRVSPYMEPITWAANLRPSGCGLHVGL